MSRFTTLTALAAVSFTAPIAAAPIFLAKGSLSGSTDLSGLTGNLENGVAANILGGLGSGLAYAGGNRFLALPDRGPNATAYNAAVDNTVSYITRFQSMTLDLVAQANGGLPFTLTPTLTATTLLYSSTPLIYGTGAGLGTKADGTPLGAGAPLQNDATHNYFTGRSDGFGPNNPFTTDARFDPESIRVSNDGATVFISDEYGPFVRQFDRTTGQLLRTYALPANLSIANKSAKGADEEAPNNSTGRVDNKGMEGLAITPDGKTLVGIMQQALLQDSSKLVRIVTIDIATGATKEFGYKLTTGTSVSEIVAINDHQFLVDERDGKGLGDGSNAAVKSVFLIDTTNAVEITNVANGTNSTPTVTKSATPFIDIYAALRANGVTADQIPAKIEGLSLGQDVVYNGETVHTLFVATDNDFLTSAGPNQFYAFGFRDSDLPGYTAQAFAPVPEPATWAMLVAGFGVVGGGLRRRRSRAAIAG